MIKGIYQAASGMLPRVKKQEVIANNLANVNTTGFKRQAVFTEELSRANQQRIPKQNSWEKPMLSDIYTDHSQAVLERTGDDFNIGLDGNGFMVVESPEGEQLYTRSGSFILSPDGMLVNADGYSLMTDAGPLALESGSSLEIGIDGGVFVDGEEAGKLMLVDFDKPYDLERHSAGMFRAPKDVNPTEPERLFVRQGYVERANVDVIHEMVEMITSFREYEANQKAIQILDDTVQRTVNQVGAKR